MTNIPQRYRVYSRSELRFSIFDPETPEISVRKRLPLPIIRNEILEFLLRMTHDNPNIRPTMKEVLSFFKAMEEKMMTQTHYTKKIGILNIDEYLNHTELDQKALCQALKEMEEVWFIDTQERQSIEYLCLRRELESENIKIGDKIFYPQDASVSIAQMLEQIRSGWQQSSYPQDIKLISKKLTLNSGTIIENNNALEDETISPMIFEPQEEKTTASQKPQA